MRSIKHFRNAKYKYYDARQKNEMRKIKNNLIYKFHYQKKKEEKYHVFQSNVIRTKLEKYSMSSVIGNRRIKLHSLHDK